MLRPIILAALAAAGVGADAHAQGSFDFSHIPGVATEPNVDVDLNGAMLAFVTQAAKASGKDAADAAAALSGLKRVRVRVYEDLRDAPAVESFVDASSKALEQAGWQRAVYVTDEDDKVRIYVKMLDQSISGMTVMVIDGGEEAVFINIDGSIEPTQLGHLMRLAGVGDMVGAFGDGGGIEGIAHERRSSRARGPERPEKPEKPEKPEEAEKPRSPGAAETPEPAETPEAPETPETPEAPEAGR